MLNAKALSELLSRNSDERLCKRWFLMTPNGTLLAYSQPCEIKNLRREANVTALSWQEQQAALLADSADPEGEVNASTEQRQLYVLTIESETANVIVRRLQAQLLLVLEGGVPPRRQAFEPRILAEDSDGEVLGLGNNKPTDMNSKTPGSSLTEGSVNNAAASVLELQRKKLDAMASAILADFEQTGFQMPDEGINKFF